MVPVHASGGTEWLAEQERSGTAPSSVSVLLVEDNDDHAGLIADSLSRARLCAFKVEHVPNGASARECLKRNTYDAVVLDRSLGDVDGLLLLSELRTLGVNVPTVLLTSGGSEEVAVGALRAGADEYLLKTEGLSGNRLWMAVLNVVERRRLQEELRTTREQATAARAALATGRAVAHDLSSPLAILIGYCDFLLMNESGLSEQGREFLSEMMVAGERARELLAKFSTIATYTETESAIGPILDIGRATQPPGSTT